MDNILSMVEGPKPTEISTVEQINEEILKEFLSKHQYGTFMKQQRVNI